MYTDQLLRDFMNDFVEELQAMTNVNFGYNPCYSIGIGVTIISNCDAAIELMQKANDELSSELPITERPNGIRWDDWQTAILGLKNKCYLILRSADIDSESNGISYADMLNPDALKDFVNRETEKLGMNEKQHPMIEDMLDKRMMLQTIVHRLTAIIRAQSAQMSKLLEQVRSKIEDPADFDLLDDYGRRYVEIYQGTKHYKQTLSDVKKQMRLCNKKELVKQLPKILASCWKDISNNEILKMVEQIHRINDTEDSKVADTKRQAYEQMLNADGTLNYENFARKVYFNRGSFNDECVNQLLGFYFTERYIQERIEALKPKKEVEKTSALPINEGFSRHVLIADKQAVMARLHDLIDGKIGRSVALAISAAQTAGVLSKKVTSTDVVNEFGDIGSVTGYNSRLKEFPDENNEEFRKVFMMFKEMKDAC